jgi:hypothetical protein
MICSTKSKNIVELQKVKMEEADNTNNILRLYGSIFASTGRLAGYKYYQSLI